MTLNNDAMKTIKSSLSKHNKTKKPLYIQRLELVPGAGVEPAHAYAREILSLLCLPISPPGRMEAVEQTTVRIL